MNVAAIVEQLQLERKIVEQRLHDLDIALAALATLNGTRTAEPRRATLHRPSPETRERARQQFEAGVPTLRIAKAVGVSDATIYAWAKAGVWKRAKA